MGNSINPCFRPKTNVTISRSTVNSLQGKITKQINKMFKLLRL